MFTVSPLVQGGGQLAVTLIIIVLGIAVAAVILTFVVKNYNKQIKGK